LFGPGKGTPWASVNIYASPTGPEGETFTAGKVLYKHNAPVALVQNLAATTVQALNATLATIGGKVVSPGSVSPFQIGIWNNIIHYGANSNSFPNVGQLVTYSVANALNQILQTGGIAGGDVYIKRAVQSFVSTALPGGYHVNGDLSALTGDISIAQNYEQYVQNASVIDALIAASPDSAFAAGWLITLQAAAALNLDVRASSDWIGGWGTFLAGLNADAEQMTASFVGNTRSITVGTTTIADTIPTDGKDIITDTTANDTISISTNGVLAANGNVLFNGAAAASGDASAIAAVIYAGPGNSTVYAGGQGDDVVGYTGAGFGNEYLAAGSLVNGAFVQSLNATWLFAGAGKDTLQGGASGGDMLAGGTGNDLMLAGSGSTLFVGGSGDDTMVGNNGNDIFQVGLGAPATLIEAGTGDDTIVFGYGDGNVTVTDVYGANGELSLGAGITWSNLAFQQSGSNLTISLVDANRNPTGDEITLDGWFTGRCVIDWRRPRGRCRFLAVTMPETYRPASVWGRRHAMRRSGHAA